MSRKEGGHGLKYFSKRYIEKHEIDFLKKSRRRFVRNKVVNHNGNFVEHLSTERLMSVVPKDDEILRMIEEYLEPALNDTWFDDKWRPKNYDFDSLPRKLRSYIKSVDMVMFHVSYVEALEGAPIDEYNRRLDKLEKTNPDFTDDDFIDHVLFGKSIPSTIGRKAKESARRAYKQVNGILKANINKFSHFVTLTFAPEKNKLRHKQLNADRQDGEYNIEFDYVDGNDFEIAKKKFSQYVNDFSKKLRKQGIEFEYLAVWELQKNGAYHFHLLTTHIPKMEQYKVPSWLDYDHREDKFERGYGLIYWDYGKSDVQEIKNHAQISTYVSKYILKSFYNVSEETYDTYLGKKKYFASRGLVRPVETYLEDGEVHKALEEFDLDDIEPFEKKYTNPYNDGLITNKIYTLLKEKSPISQRPNELPGATG